MKRKPVTLISLFAGRTCKEGCHAPISRLALHRPCLVSSFKCSNVPLFSRFRFFCSYVRNESKSFHPDRALDRDSDHQY